MGVGKYEKWHLNCFVEIYSAIVCIF